MTKILTLDVAKKNTIKHYNSLIQHAEYEIKIGVEPELWGKSIKDWRNGIKRINKAISIGRIYKIIKQIDGYDSDWMEGISPICNMGYHGIKHYLFKHGHLPKGFKIVAPDGSTII